MSQRSSFLAANGGGAGAIRVGRDATFRYCTGYDSWLDINKLHGLREYLPMVIDWAWENIWKRPHFYVDVSPCGENEQRLHVRSQACLAYGTQPPRKGGAVCSLCWNAIEACLQKAAVSLIRLHAVVIYQHGAVGEHDEAAETAPALQV